MDLSNADQPAVSSCRTAQVGLPNTRQPCARLYKTCNLQALRRSAYASFEGPSFFPSNHLSHRCCAISPLSLYGDQLWATLSSTLPLSLMSSSPHGYVSTILPFTLVYHANIVPTNKIHDGNLCTHYDPVHL